MTTENAEVTQKTRNTMNTCDMTGVKISGTTLAERQLLFSLNNFPSYLHLSTWRRWTGKYFPELSERNDFRRISRRLDSTA